MSVSDVSSEFDETLRKNCACDASDVSLLLRVKLPARVIFHNRVLVFWICALVKKAFEKTFCI
jgi:hypothetical protein